MPMYQMQGRVPDPPRPARSTNGIDRVDPIQKDLHHEKHELHEKLPFSIDFLIQFHDFRAFCMFRGLRLPPPIKKRPPV